MTIRLNTCIIACLLLTYSILPSPLRAAEAPMSLADCIALAIRGNRTIKNAYLDRVAQKYDLRMAEDKFVPTFTLAPSATGSGTTSALGGGVRSATPTSTLTSGTASPL